jgi:hypothetical protein
MPRVPLTLLRLMLYNSHHPNKYNPQILQGDFTSTIGSSMMMERDFDVTLLTSFLATTYTKKLKPKRIDS